MCQQAWGPHRVCRRGLATGLQKVNDLDRHGRAAKALTKIYIQG